MMISSQLEELRKEVYEQRRAAIAQITEGRAIHEALRTLTGCTAIEDKLRSHGIQPIPQEIPAFRLQLNYEPIDHSEPIRERRAPKSVTKTIGGQAVEWKKMPDQGELF